MRDTDTCYAELLSDFRATDLQKLVLEATSAVLVVIEKAQARPGQGVSSMFNYGTGFGRLLGWCEAFLVPHMLVTPQQWAKAMHVGTGKGDPKERSLEAALRLFPDVAMTVGKSKKPHKGIVDALLIAEWGWRHAG